MLTPAFTIVDLLAAYRQGLSLDAHIRSVWEALMRLGTAPQGDTALLYIATWEQVEAQLRGLHAVQKNNLPLYGIPFAVKDNIDVAGWPTTAACPSFAYQAKETATVVQQLQAAGAILLAKTNLDQFATGLVGTRSPYGPVPNPFDPDYISGGSSSGSASVVSRGLVCFSLGTDTAGSGRVPAGFCNLIGTKPTPGMISTEGVLPACKTLDCVSIFTLTVEDASRVLHVAETYPEQRQKEPSYHPAPLSVRLEMDTSIRVGIPDTPILNTPGYRDAYRASVVRAESLGWTVVPVDMTPLHQIAALLYEGPWVAERYSILKPLLDRAAPDVDPTVAAVVTKANTFSALDVFESRYRLAQLALDAQKILAAVDLLFLPTAPELPTLERLRQEPIAANSILGTYTNFVNLLGWCALALPSGFTADGLPFGVTLVAPGGHDQALMGCGLTWQQASSLPLGCHLQRGNPQSPESLTLPTPQNSLPIAMVGAHLQGMPLHWQVRQAGARLRARGQTAPRYALFALEGTSPAKPGLRRVTQGGKYIEVEVYDFPMASVGTFLAQVPHPLGLGNIELSDGTWVKGFICEPLAFETAKDITSYGGWRAFTRSTISA